MSAVTASSTRHLLLRLDAPSRLPEALLDALRDEVVLGGWVRGSGVLEEVRIRAHDGAVVRTLAGVVHAVVLEGSVGLTEGEVSCGLRAVLARETDRGLETIAGEIVSARVSALEAWVTAFDDVAIARRPTAADVTLMELASPADKPASEATPASAPRVAPAPSKPDLAPEPAKPPPPRPSPTFSAPAGMPPRPAKPAVEEEEEQVYPDAGDVVEHFAFGRCDVVKSDGDRLHLRLGKDGRIKEIALEMLKVTPLAAEPGAGRHFKLDRKL